MPIVVQCPQCRQRFAAAEHLAGKQVPCSSCGATLSVPPAADKPQRPGAAAAEATPVVPAAPAGTIVAACSHCGQRFAAAPHLAGRHVACPSCGQGLDVPAMPTAATPAPLAEMVDLGDLGHPDPLAAAGIPAAPRGAPSSRGLPVSARHSNVSWTDDIPDWLWWAGGGALGLCVLVFAVMILTSLLKGSGSPAAAPDADAIVSPQTPAPGTPAPAKADTPPAPPSSPRPATEGKDTKS